MVSPIDWSLQKAIHAALVADASLTALVGGPHVYDHVPRGQPYPYVTFGQSSSRDWSTGTDHGLEMIVTLHVWSRAAGRDEATRIMDAMRTVLHDQPLALDNAHLVNLRHEFSEIRRDPEGDQFHGIVRLRAVVETA